MLKIENMSDKHIDRVYNIEHECFVIPWTKASIEKELENKLAVYIVATIDDNVVGYAGMWHIVNEGHITNIAVSKDYRQRGIGDALVKGLVDIANQREMIGLTLEVRPSNEAAMKLYKNNGFKLEGIRKEYYEDNKEDAYIMWKMLME